MFSGQQKAGEDQLGGAIVSVKSRQQTQKSGLRSTSAKKSTPTGGKGEKKKKTR